MKDKLLKMLSEAEGYVSGQRLCEELNVSRTAVWKNINRLKEEGYVIEAVPNKGYCLKERPDVINVPEIKSGLQTQYWGQETIFFEEVDSTNNVGGRRASREACDCRKSERGKREKRQNVVFTGRDRYLDDVYFKTADSSAGSVDADAGSGDGGEESCLYGDRT